MTNATFTYYDADGNEQKIRCIGVPKYTDSPKIITIQTEEGEIVLDQADATSGRTSFDI